MEDIDSPGGKKANDDSKINHSSKMHYTNNATVRIQRNQAEKQRRDRLNEQISQLASLVPTAIAATKPLDKVSILRLAASWMRLNYSCLNPKHFKSAVENYLEMHSTFVSNLDVIEKSINGFVVATTFDGIILMCSRYVEDHIGYQNIDLLGYHISNYILNKERELFNKKVRNLISKFKKGSSKLRNIVRLHMQQRPLPRTNDIRYRKMSFSLTIHSGASTAVESRIRKKNFKLGQRKDFGENAVILIFIEPIRLEPDIDVMYLEQKNCYYTVHGPQGEIIFADHRISIMTGYMPRDVLGTSAYQYIHSSDVPIALFAQRAMFASSDGVGIITYRLRIHDSSYIYLQSKGQIRYKDSSKEIRQFICCNILLNAEEGNRELKKFQDRFAPQLVASKKVKPKSTLSDKEEPSLSIANAVVSKNISSHNNTVIQNSSELFSQNSIIDSEIKGCLRSSLENSKCKLSKLSHNSRQLGYDVTGKLDLDQFGSKNSMETELQSIMNPAEAIVPDRFGMLKHASREKLSNAEAAVSNNKSPVNMHSSVDYCAEQSIVNEFNTLLPLSASDPYCSTPFNTFQPIDSNSFSSQDSFNCFNTNGQDVGSGSNMDSSELFQSNGNLNHNHLYTESVDHFNLSEDGQPKNSSSTHFIGDFVKNHFSPNKFGQSSNQFCVPQSTFQKSKTYQSTCFTAPIKTYPNGEQNRVNGDMNGSSFQSLTEVLPLKLNSINSDGGNDMNSYRNELLENNDLKNSLDLSFLDQSVEEMSLLNNLSEFDKNSLSYLYETYPDDMAMQEISIQNSFPLRKNSENIVHCVTSNGINGANQSDVYKPQSSIPGDDFVHCRTEIHSNGSELSFNQKFDVSEKKKKLNNHSVFNGCDVNALGNSDLEKLLQIKRNNYEKGQNFNPIAEDNISYSSLNQPNIIDQLSDGMNAEFDQLQNPLLHECGQNNFSVETNPILNFYKSRSNNSTMELPVHLMKFDKQMNFINIPLSKKG